MRNIYRRLAVVCVFALLLGLFGGYLIAGASEAYRLGPVITNSSSNAGFGCDEMFLRSINADTPLMVCAQTKRPDSGGGQWEVQVFTPDGIIGTYDLRPAGVTECFGARPWSSRFSGTLKFVANCRYEGYGNGNDRIPIYFDTFISSEPLR